MDIKKPEKPSEISIFVPSVTPNKNLTDFRVVSRYGGLEFGTISQVAKNLGISMKSSDNGLTFTAPKARLQMFVEKLHFSLTDFKVLG